MKKEEAGRLIADFINRPNRTQDSGLLAIEAALFMEQALGILLSDEEISPDLACSQRALESFINTRIELH